MQNFWASSSGWKVKGWGNLFSVLCVKMVSRKNEGIIEREERILWLCAASGRELMHQCEIGKDEF